MPQPITAAQQIPGTDPDGKTGTGDGAQLGGSTPPQPITGTEPENAR